MDDSKAEELRSIHRDLSSYLEKQYEVVLNQSFAIAAIRKVLDGDSALSKSYKESLRDLKDDDAIRPNLIPRQALDELVRRLVEW